jgi:hypothetical protein
MSVAKFRNLGKILRSESFNNKNEIKSELISEYAFYYSAKNLLAFHILPKRI